MLIHVAMRLTEPAVCCVLVNQPMQAILSLQLNVSDSKWAWTLRVLSALASNLSDSRYEYSPCVCSELMLCFGIFLSCSCFVPLKTRINSVPGKEK